MKVRAAITVALAAFALLAFAKLHVLRDEGGGGYILWKGDEAYLFMDDRPLGYRVSMLGYLLEPLREYFNAPVPSDDDKWHLAIIRITPAGVERHDQEPEIGIAGFTPIFGDIYAHCPGGICKWTGSRFQLISEQEEQRIGGEGALKGEFTAVNGWSKRGVRGSSIGDYASHYEFSINLDEQIKLLVRGGNPVSVDVLRPDRAPERVWYHEQRTRRVSAAEYRQVFSSALR